MIHRVTARGCGCVSPGRERLFEWGVLEHGGERREVPAVHFGRTNPRCWNATLGHPCFTARPQTGRLRFPETARPALALAQHGNVRAVAVGGMNPAVLVVIGHAALRE